MTDWSLRRGGTHLHLLSRFFFFLFFLELSFLVSRFEESFCFFVLELSFWCLKDWRKVFFCCFFFCVCVLKKKNFIRKLLKKNSTKFCVCLRHEQ